MKWFILVLALAAILPAALFGSPRIIDGQHGGDAWRNFLLDFQTLIAALFAVFAAWWTVSTMVETDQAAERRHREQIKLLLRQDTAKIHRLLAEVPTRLRIHAAMIKDFESAIPEGQWEPVWDKDTRAALAMALSGFRQIKALSSDPILIQCRDLYPPEVEQNLRFIEEWIGVSTEMVPKDAADVVALMRPGGETERPDWFDTALTPIMCDVGAVAFELADRVEAWGAALLRD